MNKLFAVIGLTLATSFGFAQTPKDVVTSSGFKFTWVGIDYSHAKFVGNFSQFADAGQKGMIAIKEGYFYNWNELVLREQEKYSVADMLRKEMMNYDVDAMHKINEGTPVEEMEGRAVEFTKEDVQGFIKDYKFDNDGIGVMFLAEYLDKYKENACFHVVIFNMENNEIILHDRVIGEAGGFGLRNYWARPILLTMEHVGKRSFKVWKKQYGK